MNEVSRSHDQTVIELLQADPHFADIYLETALEEVYIVLYHLKVILPSKPC